MDTIEFRVEVRHLGVGRQDCVEIAINGRDLGEWLGAIEVPPEPGYAGLDPRWVLTPNSRFLDDPTAPLSGGDPAYEHPDDPARRCAYILRCICGDTRCSYALAKIRVGAQRVTWSDLCASRRCGRVQTVGPFEFDRAEYEQALRRAVRED